MSASDRVLLSVPADDGVQVTVADHSFAPVGSGTGGVSVEVDPGLYSVRYVAGSTVHQELVAVPPGEPQVNVPRPSLRFDSPAPLAAATPVAETHLQAARRLCGEVHQQLGTGAQLFVFVRDRDRRGRRSPMTGLSLHDVRGEQLLDLNAAGSSTSESDRHPLWAGVNLAVDPGPYLLRVRTGAIGTLEQLVHLARGWQTQMFVERRGYPGGAGGRSADLGDASILMAPIGRGFDPERDDLRLTELARQALSSGRAVLAKGDLSSMLFMKFDNPMLGIYGAHLLLRRGDGRDGVLAEVCRNLERLVPGHPDAAAIGLAIGTAPNASFPLPPMLRASWELVIEASAGRPDLVPRDSLAGRIAGSVYDASTWLIWRKEREPREALESRRPAKEDISVVALMNNLVAAVPDLGDVHRRAYGEMEPIEQDLLTFAASAGSASPTEPAAGVFDDEGTMLKALGMPKSVVQSKLLDVADRLDVTLE